MNISPTIIWKILKLVSAYNNTSKCLLCLNEKLENITHPSQNAMLNTQKFYPKADKRKKKDSHIFTHTHLTYTTSTIKITPQITPQHTRKYHFPPPTTHPTHCKYHLPLLIFYIHQYALPQPVDIMLAILSWVLKIRLNTVYLTYPSRTHSHILK